ncbi:elongation factor 1-gamma [Filobasidium floriforme]|uniref:elongation factor 1-gamma n=1 Tax=Filobasidium floriforme TaxID=5210 RepID=UPI001E8D4FCE|nr:elongation factor 1-gamma [Filobasidium floriforme]KAH8089107.1 elongation factor 1-gamma [Filobasidium floriforme]
MSSLGKIYSYPNNWRVARARAAAVLGGSDIELIMIDMQTTKRDDYLAKFPAGCVPAFEATDGTIIQQSGAIATYAAMAAPSGKLLSDDKATAAKIAEWCAFADTEIAQYHGVCQGLVAGWLAYAKPTYTSIFTKLEQRLATLNKVLEDKTFLVGDRMTLADIFVASAVFSAFTGRGHVDKATRAKYGNVARHMETIVKNPKLVEVYGEFEYVESAPQYVAPKKDAKPKAEKKAEDKPKAEKAPKAPKEKKPVEKDDDDEEPLVPEEPKAKNPLDDLPKSEFNLENWKRVYSNSDGDVAMKFFKENFDTNGFSIWRVDYKYNSELTQVFMSSNLIGGYFTRMEAARKYLFGSMGVCGTSNNSVISGVLVCRGDDILPVVQTGPDWESFTYQKLSLDNEEDVKFIEKSFDWTLEVDGKTWADGKNYK